MRGFSIILMMVSILLFVGCGQSLIPKTLTFSSTVKATYGGRAVEGAAILRQPLLNSPQGYTRGEATIIDLGNNKRAYMVLIDRGGLSRLYMNVLSNTFFSKKEYAKWPEGTDGYDIWASLPFNEPKLYDHRNNHLAKSLREKYFAYPLIVAFKNEADPTSLILVDTEKPSKLFGKTFKFEGLYIAKVPDDTPLTNKIINYLPWVDIRHNYWRGVKGDALISLTDARRPRSEMELGEKLRRSTFASRDRNYP